MDILNEIVERTRALVGERRAICPLAQLKAGANSASFSPISLVDKLTPDRPHVIAEFKRKSPSKPHLQPDADLAALASSYQEGGASAMSILTEPFYFAGALEDLETARKLVSIPLLRKDFMIDPYQFYEAKLGGASLVLLIARILEKQQLADFCLLAHDLGMEVLCEIHRLEELDKVGATPIDFLGVNCRDLQRFETDLDHLVAVARHLPATVAWVAESGIHGPRDLNRLYRAGYRLFLIGEYLMTSHDPTACLKDLIS